MNADCGPACGTNPSRQNRSSSYPVMPDQPMASCIRSSGIHIACVKWNRYPTDSHHVWRQPDQPQPPQEELPPGQNQMREQPMMPGEQRPHESTPASPAGARSMATTDGSTAQPAGASGPNSAASADGSATQPADPVRAAAAPRERYELAKSQLR